MATSDSTMRRPDSTTTPSNSRTNQERLARSSCTVPVLVKRNSVVTAPRTISSIRVESKLDVSQSLTVDAVQTWLFSSGLCRRVQQRQKLIPPVLSRPVRSAELRAGAEAETTNNTQALA